jgi:PAS domain S-box-containing protein
LENLSFGTVLAILKAEKTFKKQMIEEYIEKEKDKFREELPANLSEEIMNSDSLVKDNLTLYSKYNILLQTIRDGLILIKKQKIKYTNKFFADMVRYSLEEIRDSKIDKYISPAFRQMVLERYEKRQRGESVPSNYEIDLIDKNGKIIPVLLSVGLVSSETDKMEFVIIHDLSELSTKTNELKTIENEFEIIFNHTSVAIGLLDLQGNLIRVNQKWRSLFECKEKSPITKSITDLFFPQDRELFINSLNDLFSNKTDSFRFQKYLLKKNQSRFYGDVSVSAVKNLKDELQFFILSIMDISDRLEISNKFEQERKLQQYFMEYIPDSIYFKDKQSRFIKANRATVEKMGLDSVDELLGKTDFDFFNDEHAKESRQDELEIINSGISILNKIEKEIWPDGKITWVSTTKIPLRDEENNIIGTFGVTRDITSLKKAEDIRDALYKISTAVATVPDIENLFEAIHKIIMELMKAENFYIAMYDEKTDMVSFPYFVDQVDPPPEPRKAGSGLTEYVLRCGKAMLIDAETDLQLRASGDTSLLGEPTQIWLGVPLKVEGKTIGVITVQDYSDPTTYGEEEKEILTYVSEQIALAIDKKYNEQKIIKYSEELKELNASKDKFFSIIAHDLKSPFHGLLGLSRMISEELDSMDKLELKSSLQILKESTENIYALIENLLDWSRLETGRMKFQPAYQNMFMIVEDIRRLLNQNARIKDITLRNKLAHTSRVWGDSNMLKSLIQNLISNAIKFTPVGGSVEITELHLDSFIQYTVSDTGVGLSAEDIDKLFKLDSNFSKMGTEQEKGTGLGLILCKEIINIHGGKIMLESELDKGTKIIFTLRKFKD